MSDGSHEPTEDTTKVSVAYTVLSFLSMKLATIAVFVSVVVWIAKNPEKTVNVRAVNFWFYFVPFAFLLLLGVVSKALHARYYREVDSKWFPGTKSYVYTGTSRVIPVIKHTIELLIIIIMGVVMGWFLVRFMSHGPG